MFSPALALKSTSTTTCRDGRHRHGDATDRHVLQIDWGTVRVAGSASYTTRRRRTTPDAIYRRQPSRSSAENIERRAAAQPGAESSSIIRAKKATIYCSILAGGRRSWSMAKRGFARDSAARYAFVSVARQSHQSAASSYLDQLAAARRYLPSASSSRRRRWSRRVEVPTLERLTQRSAAAARGLAARSPSSFTATSISTTSLSTSARHASISSTCTGPQDQDYVQDVSRASSIFACRCSGIGPSVSSNARHLTFGLRPTIRATNTMARRPTPPSGCCVRCRRRGSSFAEGLPRRCTCAHLLTRTAFGTSATAGKEFGCRGAFSFDGPVFPIIAGTRI